MVKWCKKIPFYPDANFLLPVHATFTSDFHFRGVPSNFLSLQHFYTGLNSLENTSPLTNTLPTSCTCYIHFRFPFLGCATKFKKFLSFNAPYGGFNGWKFTFPSLYLVACPRLLPSGKKATKLIKFTIHREGLGGTRPSTLP